MNAFNNNKNISNLEDSEEKDSYDEINKLFTHVLQTFQKNIKKNKLEYVQKKPIDKFAPPKCEKNRKHKHYYEYKGMYNDYRVYCRKRKNSFIKICKVIPTQKKINSKRKPNLANRAKKMKYRNIRYNKTIPDIWPSAKIYYYFSNINGGLKKYQNRITDQMKILENCSCVEFIKISTNKYKNMDAFSKARILVIQRSIDDEYP